MTLQKALVVDDSRLARVALSKLLTRRNLDVDVAGSGQEALDYLRQQAPDVVFIDYMMPDMDGFEAAQAIQALPERDPLPLVMYTSQDSDEDRSRARDIGICGFLSKPASEALLDQVLSDAAAWQPEVPDPDAEVADPAPVTAGAAEEIGEPAAAPAVDEAADDAGPGFDVAVPADGAHASIADEPSLDEAEEPAYPEQPESADPVPAATVPAEGVDPGDVPGDADREPDVAATTEPAADGHAAAETATGEDAAEVEQRQLRAAAAAAREEVAQKLDEAEVQWQHRLDRLEASMTEGLDRRVEQARGEMAELAQRLEALQQASPEPASGDYLQETARTEARAAVAEWRQEIREEAARAARTAAEQVVERALERQAPASSGPDTEAVTEQVDQVLRQRLEGLSDSEAFREQVIASLTDHGIPVLKNAMDQWVRDVATEAAEAAVDKAVANASEAVVQEAVAAAAESAAAEAHAAHARTRHYMLIGGGVLAAGVLAALILAL
ncbi:MAG: response regulator [Ectothiorhodospiraceae bacterium]